MSRPVRVLVVDDDFMVARIHTRFVERTPGFEVLATVHSGAEAIRAVESLDPDLVLLDVHLPDRSGLDVLAELRSAGRRVAVVIVTAERGAAAVRTALHGGAMQYLVKPFEYDDLADRLRRVAAVLTSLPSGTTDADGDTPVDQAAIDAAFGTATTTPTRVAALPKGLSGETAALVLAALRSAEELSASETGDAVGLSRVTARRYLEHFVDTGEAVVRLQYGVAGRPERRYRAGPA